MDPKKQPIRSYEVIQAMAALVVVFAIVLITFLLWFDLLFLALLVFGVTVWTLRNLRARAEQLRQSEMLLELAKEQLTRQIGLMFEDIQKTNQMDVQYVRAVAKLGERTIYQWAIWDGIWFEYEGLASDGMMTPVVLDPKSAQKVILQGCIYVQSQPDANALQEFNALKANVGERNAGSESNKMQQESFQSGKSMGLVEEPDNTGSEEDIKASKRH